MKRKRAQIRVEPVAGRWRVSADLGWATVRPRRFARREGAVRAARLLGRRLLAAGMPAELRIRQRNGTWSTDEATYGNDPRRSRG